MPNNMSDEIIYPCRNQIHINKKELRDFVNHH